jgi:hypothetical protein
MDLNMLDSLVLQVRMIYVISDGSWLLATAIRLDVTRYRKFCSLTFSSSLIRDSISAVSRALENVDALEAARKD